VTDIKPQFKGNIGMFLVCAEFSKRNLIAMPTSRNTKGYDIVVLEPETHAATGIQVKCTDKKDFPVFSSHWRDYEHIISQKIVCPFVFVDISDWATPRYFVLSDIEMKELLKDIIRTYAREFGKKQGLSWEGILEREERENLKGQLWAVKLDKIESHESHWETITNRLKNLGIAAGLPPGLQLGRAVFSDLSQKSDAPECP